MELGFTRRGVVFDTSVEDWMHGLNFAEGHESCHAGVRR